MRLVCPNCVAQYEVADGTIPDSGRDVQCANCNHVWFQDAAFKLSTDDLTHVPQKLHATYDDEADDGGDDTPGIFLSKRAAQPAGIPTETAERTLPEVGDNVLDILRSEAAFSSRRRAAARVHPADRQPEPEDSADIIDADRHRIGSRDGDTPPPEPETGAAASGPSYRATDDMAENTGAPAAAADFRKLDWRHTDDSGSGGWEPAGPDSATTFVQEETEHVRGLAADEAKRIAEAAVARSGDSHDAKPEKPPVSAEEAAEQDQAFRQTIRRISVRSLTDPAPAEEQEEAAPASRDLNRQMPETPDLRADLHEDELVEDTVADKLHAATVVADDILPEDDAADPAEIEAEEEYLEAAYAEPGAETDVGESFEAEDPAAEGIDADTADDAQEADETGPLPTPTEDPEDIRSVRRSLVENRKVLLPDVDELNTSLRMEDGEDDVDLRSSAFSEEAADRNRFWLGLVTALMLFGILSTVYVMAPAISDSFPAADPYMAAYRDMADSALVATAKAWVPVVDWLESL